MARLYPCSGQNKRSWTISIARIIGWLLRGVHAGENHLLWNHAALADAPQTISLTSPAFAPAGPIPLRHAGQGVGQNISPALAWDGVPPDAEELVLVVEDPGAPLPRPFVHWIVTGIAPSSHSLVEGVPSVAIGGLSFGRNSFGRSDYAGPRALPGHGVHDYVFQMVALNRALGFEGPPSRAELVRALPGAVIARGRLTGTFERT
jgi:Raf kinase inhibitor-like YbhB/YbcL family protein